AGLRACRRWPRQRPSRWLRVVSPGHAASPPSVAAAVFPCPGGRSGTSIATSSEARLARGGPSPRPCCGSHCLSREGDMRYTRISADCHIDMPWLPPDLFTANASALMKDRMPYVVEGPDGLQGTPKQGPPFVRAGGIR